MEHIPNKDLELSHVPKTLRNWGRFALTFDGYEYHGSVRACAKIANRRAPRTLTEYRTCLFFEQRRWRHFGIEPSEKTRIYIRSLITGIRNQLKARDQKRRGPLKPTSPRPRS